MLHLANNGVFLALFAYACFAWGDGIIKSLSGQAGVFGIAFYTMLFTGVLMFFTKPKDEDWRHFWRTDRPWAVHGRAIAALFATILGVYAFTTIPLAETYALFFISPLFITVLSVIFLRESVGPWRWLAVIAGFGGVLLVVRPGFKALELGHLAALMVALLAAVSMILLRSMANEVKRTTVFGVLIAYGLVVTGVLMLATGEAQPGGYALAAMAAVGVLAGTAHTVMFRAARLAPANQIAPTHYSQIFWAVLIGGLFFDETPDGFAIVGLVVIIASGLLTYVRERIRLGTVRWNPFLRNRL